MMATATSRFHLEPPPWLYARLAKGPLFRRLYRRFVADLAAALPPGARVLDVGTGPGYLPAYLARERPDLDLSGLDLSDRMIRRAARRHPELRKWSVADAQALPFPAGVFDQTIASFSLHIWPDRALGVQELVRVLKPGGRAWIFELRREAAADELRQFARAEGLPFLMVYPGFKVVSWHHSLRQAEFDPILRAAAGCQWELQPVHHLLWRAELRRAQVPAHRPGRTPRDSSPNFLPP
ncbi:MAG: class I SAM-dependent methyltransferase [Deltaproteobacteria bacterium]|nr:class I SAM-dependent methyltransferase [Deltaproteobacteria bacterium]